MLTIQIATDDDLAAVDTIDPSYATAFAWQMDHRAQSEEILVRFRAVRLPHLMRPALSAQPPPSEAEAAPEAPEEQADLFLMARDDSELIGYLKATTDARGPVAWLDQVAVKEPRRRQGVGTALIDEAKDWGRGRGLSALMAGVKTQNYPATRFLQRCGFVFCGYNDHSYPGPNITLLFCCELK